MTDAPEPQNPLEARVADATDWDTVKDYATEIVSLAHRPARDAIVAALETVMVADGEAADFGCGPGYFLEALSAAKRIHAVDWSESMLTEARTRAPAQTVFHRMDLKEPKLDHPVDIALSVNALLPKSHRDGQIQLRAMMDAVRPGGALVLVALSLESHLYVINIAHHVASAAGFEDESRQIVVDDFSATSGNPLGYAHAEGGWLQKAWLAEEIEALLHHFGAASVERFKAPVYWTDYVEARPWQSEFAPPWHWGFVVRKAGSRGGTR